MTTLLEKTLKRQLSIGGRAYVLAVSPEGLKLTLKGRRKGLELQWESLVSGDAALAVALNASLGRLAPDPPAHTRPTQAAQRPNTKGPLVRPKIAGRITKPPARRSKH